MVRLTVAAASLARTRLADSPSVVLLTFCLMIVFCVLAVAGSRWAAVLVIPVAVAWVVVNGRVEGPVLLRLNHEHGVTASDLLSLVALLLALWRLAGRSGGG